MRIIAFCGLYWGPTPPFMQTIISLTAYARKKTTMASASCLLTPPSYQDPPFTVELGYLVPNSGHIGYIDKK